ncbi:MAG: nitroreductase family protein [Bacteroidales bacterium]
MNTSKILNLILAIALVVLSVKMAFYGNGKSLVDDSAKVTLDNIYTRTSIRAYESKEVEDEKIQQILKAGMAAPTAVNKQPWQFVVVKKKEVLQALAAELPHAKMTANAPFAIVACGDLSKALEGNAAAFWIQDVSAATENILLAAHALGLGAVWTGVYPSDERVKSVQGVLHLPEHVIPLCVIPIGYPAENPMPKDKWKTENIHYDYWTESEPVVKSETVTSSEWVKVDPMKGLNVNPFTLFSHDWMALAVGKKGDMNAMTIGWGGLGVLWGHERPVITVYVEKSRYTHSFMERNEYFTVTAFPEANREALMYLGTHSGRDGDKIKASGLTLEYTDLGNPIFKEGKLVLECKKIYGAPFNPEGFGELAKKEYSKRQLHSVYIGEIVNAWVKK